MKIPEKLKIVAVSWLDSEGSAYDWVHSDDVDYSGELPLCFSAGILLHEDEHKVVLVQNLAHLNHTDLKQLGHVITIPKIAIINNKINILAEFNSESLQVKEKKAKSKLWTDCAKRKAKSDYVCILCGKIIKTSEQYFSRGKKKAHVLCGERLQANPKDLIDGLNI